MHSAPIPVQPPGLSLGDVYFILFRHKWKIVSCTLLGVAACVVLYRTHPPEFVSEAKLFVRYIISENKALGPTKQDTTAKSPDQRGETIMKSEAEIIGSLDLAQEVVKSIGPERILAKLGGGKEPGDALVAIKKNLDVNVTPNSSVIHVLFKHPDASIVQPVLKEVIERYLKLHMETHTASGMLGDFLNQETDQLRSRLAQTEDDLRKASNRAGIISLQEAKESFSQQLAAIRRDLYSSQADLAQKEAILKELTRRKPDAVPTPEEPTESRLSPEVLTEYRGAVNHLESLRRMEQQLLTLFTAENARVKEIRDEIATTDTRRRRLEQNHPSLVRVAVTPSTPVAPEIIDPTLVATQITALQAKIGVLNSQYEQLRSDIAKVEQMEGTIVELQRKKELEEANYRYFSANLEQSRINETLGNGRVSNISQIQAPSPPFADASKINKLLGLLLAGGLFTGIAWAFVIEQYFDRSIKRPIDIERNLQVPLFISIPAVRPGKLKAAELLLNGSKPLLTSGDPGTDGGNGVRPSTPLEVFHETLRDRLISYFESVNLTHKPKLVAITGLESGAGVTTTAAGLARSLSETGEGSVLLVDMNSGEGAAHQFVRGRAVCGLDELLQSPRTAQVESKLYVVAESNSDRLSRNLPQRFTKIVPRLKASDFDYILFDMPTISQISITPRLAGFMDMVLVVVESERTGRDLVQRATALLGETRAHVGVVLNKTRRYVPARLYQESLS